MTIQELVNGNGGITNIIFNVPLMTMDGEPIPCRIIEPEDDLYSLSNNYKLRVEPIDPVLLKNFGYRNFYQGDFMKMIEDGTITFKIMDQMD